MTDLFISALAKGGNSEMSGQVMIWTLLVIVLAWLYVPLSFSHLSARAAMRHRVCSTSCPGSSSDGTSGQNNSAVSNASTSGGESSENDTDSTSDGSSSTGSPVRGSRSLVAQHDSTIVSVPSLVGAAHFPDAAILVQAALCYQTCTN